MKIRSVKENIKLKGGLKYLSAAPRHDIYLVLDNIRSMYNVGAIFRSAEGARVKKIYLCGMTATPPREKIFKTSLGAVNFVPWEYRKTAAETICQLKNDGVQIIALEQTDQSVNYSRAKYKKPLAIVVGHELKGVSKNALAVADLHVEIPMHGRANSLNVATATGIILFKILEKTN
jgi:tRNA G18 (ribose-2'-O)-methylase SpoU